MRRDETQQNETRRGKRKRSKVARFFRRFFMCVGILTTAYWMLRLLVFLLVEITVVV